MRILTLITALLAVSLPVRALEVLTTIKPLGFIAAAITDGVSEPKVLLPTGASPHDFALRPSDIRSINGADLVVWVGPELEGFMTKPLAKHPHALTLTQVPGMPLFNYVTQESHNDHDHEHEAQAHGDHDEGHGRFSGTKLFTHQGTPMGSRGLKASRQRGPNGAMEGKGFWKWGSGLADKPRPISAY